MNLTKEEKEFVYFQLLARKQYFEQEMKEYAEQNNPPEMLRCAQAIEKLNQVMKKLLS